MQAQLKQMQERLAASEAANQKMKKVIEDDYDEKRRQTVLTKHKLQEIKQQVINADAQNKDLAQKLDEMNQQLKQAHLDIATVTKERNLSQQLATKRAHELAVAHSLVNELEKKTRILADEKQQLLADLRHEKQRQGLNIQDAEEKHRKKYNSLKQLLGQYRVQVMKFQELTEAN